MPHHTTATASGGGTPTKAVALLVIKASYTTTVIVTSSFKGKACSSVFIERKQNHHQHYTEYIYNGDSMGEQYNRLLKGHNDSTPDEAGLQSELGHDKSSHQPCREEAATVSADEPKPPNKTPNLSVATAPPAVTDACLATYCFTETKHG